MPTKSGPEPNVPKFLRALYDMLQYEDPAILAWSHDGACFQVFDVQRLEHEVLAKYFKHSKFSSLQRQLNNFGFRKWTKTRANVCTFSHDVMRRCHPEQLPAMVHRSEAATAARASYLEAASVKRPRAASEAEAPMDGSSKRLHLESYPEYNDFGVSEEPEAPPSCSDVLDGFMETDLCELDWSLVTDHSRQDDLLALIDPLMNEDAAPITTTPEPQLGFSTEALPLADVDQLTGSAWWLDILAKMLADC